MDAVVFESKMVCCTDPVNSNPPDPAIDPPRSKAPSIVIRLPPSSSPLPATTVRSLFISVAEPRLTCVPVITKSLNVYDELPPTV